MSNGLPHNTYRHPNRAPQQEGPGTTYDTHLNPWSEVLTETPSKSWSVLKAETFWSERWSGNIDHTAHSSTQVSNTRRHSTDTSVSRKARPKERLSKASSLVDSVDKHKQIAKPIRSGTPALQWRDSESDPSHGPGAEGPTHCPKPKRGQVATRLMYLSTALPQSLLLVMLVSSLTLRSRGVGGSSRWVGFRLWR